MSGRRWRSLGATVLAALAAGSLRPPLAVACSYGPSTAAQREAAAEYIFTGTTVRMEDPTNPTTYSSGDPLHWTFVVDEVEKGNVGERFTVAAARSEASCGFEFELGQRYRVLAQTGDDGPATTWLGSGTEEVQNLPDPPPIEGESYGAPWNLVEVAAKVVHPLVGVVVAWFMQTMLQMARF